MLIIAKMRETQRIMLKQNVEFQLRRVFSDIRQRCFYTYIFITKINFFKSIKQNRILIKFSIIGILMRRQLTLDKKLIGNVKAQNNYKSQVNSPSKTYTSKPVATAKVDNKRTYFKRIDQNYTFMKKDDSSISSKFEFDTRDYKIDIPLDKEKLQSIVRLNSQVQNQIVSWLVKLFDVVTSASFKYVMKGQLSDKESKNFAAKNILRNIKYFLENLRNLQSTQKVKLMKFLNDEINNILSELLPKFPQSASKGASQRLRQKIQKIDNRNSNEYDFLKRNNLKFEYKQDEDYSSEIMIVLNKLIHYSSEPFDEENGDVSNYEKFTQVIQSIFIDSQFVKTEELVSTLLLTMKGNMVDFCGQKSQQFDVVLKDMFPDYDKTCERDSQTIQSVIKTPKEMKQTMNSSYKRKTNLFNSTNLTSKDQLQSITYQKVKQNVKYVANHKIPLQTQIFTKQQIQLGKFRVKNASVLRILTKWTQQLSQKIVNSKQLILKRVQKFKTNSGLEISLDEMQKKALEQASRKEVDRIQIFLKEMNKEKLQMQMKFAQQIYEGKYVRDDTNVGVFASKLQQITGQYMFFYLNKLIHSLLSLPIKASRIYMREFEKQYQKGTENSYQKQSREDWLLKINCDKKVQALKSIDLISFKMGDLMRARVNCSQQYLFKIYDTLYGMSKAPNTKLKIVRIKNRLDQKDNDVLMNLFWNDKVQIEIQLGVTTDLDIKAKFYSSFNHSLYELQRAEFGPIGELACIIGEHDPVIKSFTKYDNYTPEIKSHFINSSFTTPQVNSVNKLKKMGRVPFVCQNCKKLKCVYNPKFYERQAESMYQCNQCYAARLENNQELPFVKRLIAQIYANKGKEQSKEYKFYANHLYLWKFNEKQLKIDGKDYLQQRLPQKGMLIDKNKKKPQIKLFQRFIEDDAMYFVYKDTNKSIVQILFKIDYHDENFMKKLKQNLSHLFIFGIKNRYKRKSYDISKERDLRKLRDYVYEEKDIECRLDGCSCGDFKLDLPLNKKLFRKYLNNQILDTLLKEQKHDIYLRNKGITTEIKDYIEKIIMNSSVDLVVLRTLFKKDGKDQLKWLKSQFQHIKNINLEYNQMEDIKFLFYFEKLTDLNLHSSEMLSNLSGIQNCSKLRYLTITKTKITSIKEFRNLTNLVSLKLNHNDRLESLEGLQKCLKLEVLEVSQAKIDSLKPIQNCQELQCLVVSAPKIVTFSHLRNLTKIRVLHVLHCLILSNLVGIQSLKNLEELVIVGAEELKKINYLSKCLRLKKFSVYHSCIYSLEGINSTELKEINLEKCYTLRQIDIPEHVMKGLQVLFINDCKKLEDFGCINEAVRLTSFQAWNNKCLKASQYKKLSKCTKLEDLNLNGNSNQSITLGLKSLSFLENLNQLRSFNCNDNILPESEYKYLHNCRQLTNLSLKNNKNLRSLEYITSTKIERLDIGCNLRLKDFQTSLCYQQNIVQISLQKIKTDYQLSFWSGWSKLEILNVRGSSVKLQGLNCFPELEKLYVGRDDPFLKQQLSKALGTKKVEVFFQRIPENEVNNILEKTINGTQTGKQNKAEGPVKSIFRTNRKRVSRESIRMLSRKKLI